MFTGEWTSIDSGDGSTQHLSIQGGTRPQIVYIDEVASSACEGQDVATFTAILTGFVDDDTLDAGFVVAKCGARNVLTRANRFGVTYLFDAGADAADPSDDTLLDDFGDIWHRA